MAHNAPGSTPFLNGDQATRFNGVNQYIEVKDKDSLSITANGVLTMEAWVRPDVLNFSPEESDEQPAYLGVRWRTAEVDQVSGGDAESAAARLMELT